jgi:hypothetical protein
LKNSNSDVSLRTSTISTIYKAAVAIRVQKGFCLFRNGSEVSEYGRGLYSSDMEAKRVEEIIRSDQAEFLGNLLR